MSGETWMVEKGEEETGKWKEKENDGSESNGKHTLDSPWKMKKFLIWKT